MATTKVLLSKVNNTLIPNIRDLKPLDAQEQAVFDKNYKALKESIKKSEINISPISVRKLTTEEKVKYPAYDYATQDGHTRYSILQELGAKYVNIFDTENINIGNADTLDKDKAIQTINNMSRVDMTAEQKAMSLEEYINAGISATDIAALIGISRQWVSRLIKLYYEITGQKQLNAREKVSTNEQRKNEILDLFKDKENEDWKVAEISKKITTKLKTIDTVNKTKSAGDMLNAINEIADIKFLLNVIENEYKDNEDLKAELAKQKKEKAEKQKKEKEEKKTQKAIAKAKKKIETCKQKIDSKPKGSKIRIKAELELKLAEAELKALEA